MKKFRRFVVIFLAALLVLGMGTAVSAKGLQTSGPKSVKAEKEVKEFQTGRTTQARTVDNSIVPNQPLEFTSSRNVESVFFSGTVTLDGPELIVAANGMHDLYVNKIGEKTWEYSFYGDISDNFEHNTAKFTIQAHTIYSGGRPYDDVHTTAVSITHLVNVPFITETHLENINWDYNRSDNEFILTYDIRNVWSDGGEDEVFNFTEEVIGSEYYFYVEETDEQIPVPFAYRDFTFSDANFVWTYEKDSSTYSVKFDIIKTDTKGVQTTESKTREALTPGENALIEVTISDEFGEIKKSINIDVPLPPLPEIIEIRDVTDISLVLNEHGNGFRVIATYTIVYSDKSTETVTGEQLSGLIGDPRTAANNSTTRDYYIGGILHVVTVIHDTESNKFIATAVKKATIGLKG